MRIVIDFFKKNYEKILLVIVLLGLVAALVLLLIIIPQKQSHLEELRTGLLNPHINALPALDMTLESAALQRVQSPDALDFTTQHKLFNPVLWLMRSDGHLLKIDSDNKIGPGALAITAITPLYLRVVYGEPTADGYLVHVDDEAAARPYDREKNTIVSPSSPSDIFTLKSVTGPPDNPPQLEMEFKDTHEPVTITPDRAFERVDGYTADLNYPPDPNLPPWPARRVGDRLKLEGYDYIIIAINSNSVVVSSRENNKKTTIPFSPTTETH
jgi:hypothetical protein